LSPINQVYVAAVAAGFAVSMLSLLLWRRLCWRAGLVDEPGSRKHHAAPVPLAGGLAILTGWLAALGLAWAWAGLRAGVEPRMLDVPPMVLAGALGMAAVGWWDDRTELRPGAKLAGQVVVAAATAAAGIRITLFVPSPLFSLVVTVLWIVTVTNALNFTDNMNGLATGLGAVAAGCVALHAIKRMEPSVGVLALALCGAALGFLPYNFPRATAFLGDCGSHLLGYGLAVLTILPDFYSPAHRQPWAVLSPLLILAVPLLDLAWVVAVRLYLGRPVYVGDTNHLSHQLTRRGLSPTAAVVVLWVASAVLGAASLWL
jgi:UDP-GlcNAc:undecaprenyl-phosphate GlcNAc-1-phosphate transferase